MRVAVLVSAQSKHPPGTAPWIQQAVRAVRTLASEGHSFVVSLGMITWELVAWQVGQMGARAHVVCAMAEGADADEFRKHLINGFHLRAERLSWEELRGAGRSGRHKETWEQRDRRVIDAADVLVPVSLRPGGRLAALVKDSGRPVDGRFEVSYERGRGAGPQWEKRGPQSLPVLDGESLIHFTRAADGPWPGEAPADFYAELAAGAEGYPRGGFETLCRIVRERRLRGSNFRIRSGQGAVCLTGLPLGQALSLVRWRARFSRYTVEPYGIAIGMREAIRLGARPVRYLTKEEAGSRTDDALVQGHSERANWEAETEWRLLGDLDLAECDPSCVRVLTATAGQARELGCISPFAVVGLGYREAER